MDERGTRIPFGALPAVQRATALGRIDLTLLKGWVTPEEWLYPAVQTALSAWTRSNRPHHEVVRIVGERWSPASHRLRDALTRNTVPIGFYAIESDEGRRLVDRVQPGPRAFTGGHSSQRFGPLLADGRRGGGSDRSTQRLLRRTCTMWRSSERVRPVSPPESTAPPRGCGRSSLNPSRSADRLDRAR